MHVVAEHELLDQEACHDRLPCAWVVGKQETQGAAGEHLAVHRADLVGERFDLARGDRDHRIEETRTLDPLCLGGELEVVG
ncbi:hypothetical protein ACQE98_17675 [Ornithinimicrobium sp. W1679]|uniref:hypothetical protein n=1 Tax=Ornithinimicrobium sp. W1679 TaxID=3418770 RepID=UPI003CF0DD1D